MARMCDPGSEIRLALFSVDGVWRGLVALPNACAVAATPAGGCWAAGQNEALWRSG